MSEEKNKDILDIIPENLKPSQKRTNHLFCIGINNYQYVSKLSNAVLDVEAFAELMEKEYDFLRDNIFILKDKDATKESIIDKLEEYAEKLTDKDNFLLYFSGHGIKHQITKRGYWLPVEGKEKKLHSWLSNDTVLSYLEHMAAHHIFLLIDACFSGSFFTSTRSHISKFDKEPSRFAITSGAEEVVSDGQEGIHSPFASSLLEYLRNHKEPAFGAKSLYEWIKGNMSTSQLPQGGRIKTGKYHPGEFVFYRKNTPKNKEEIAFREAEKIGTEEVWWEFIDACEDKKYPGKFKLKAENQLQVIWEKRNWEDVKRRASLYSLKSFIRFHSTSPFLSEAQALLDDIKKDPDKLTLQNEPAKTHPPAAISKKVNKKDNRLLNALGIKMIKVEAGSFIMGGEDPTQLPIREVEVPEFYLGEFPVTQRQWLKVMAENPSSFQGDLQRPVENISWDDCQEFIKKLNKQTGMEFRLPSEVEWEFAASGGDLSKEYTYAGGNQLDEVGWYIPNSNQTTHPVGQKKPNELGLYDMSGNVWEWCEDDWHDNYKGAPIDGSAWVDQSRTELRVVRGGSWHSVDDSCRVAIRLSSPPSVRDYDLGFRLSGYLAR